MTYVTAFLTVVSIVLQALNQYLILPYNIKSVLNNLVIITILFLSITIILFIMPILPILIYKRKKINFSFFKRNRPLTPFGREKEDSEFAKDPIKYFMDSLKDDEIKETLK